MTVKVEVPTSRKKQMIQCAEAAGRTLSDWARDVLYREIDKNKPA